MSLISIVTASRINFHFLDRLLKSLQKQDFQKFEVIVCLTNPLRVDEERIQALAPNLTIRVVSTAVPSIASARNEGIRHARGAVILFLDEDCFLPRSTYLKDLATFHRKNPTFAAGGYYRTFDGTSQSDRFYNFVCNTWVQSHQEIKSSAPVLLGGCCFYPRNFLQKHQIFFDETHSRAGEEYLLNLSWTKHGLPLLLSNRWSVFHKPETSFYDVFRKSWTQGAQLHPHRAIFQADQLKKGLKFLRNEKEHQLIYLSLLGLYGAIGRLSFFRQIAIERYTRKASRVNKKGASPPFVKQLPGSGQPLARLRNKKRKTLNTAIELLKNQPLKNTNSAKTSAKTTMAKQIGTN